ncbi:MAG: hypothetical protein GF331_25955 [Chitinivibrionales bacterium]|nr:hypothetical protein [Chitinivibrionales bacterium]
MIFRTGMLLSVLLYAAVSAQTATVELNCVLDDDGEIWLNGQQFEMPPRASNPDDDTTAGPVTVQQGTNVIALRCIDGGWTGGLIASADLTVVGTDDTMRTNEDWVCTDYEGLSATGADISVDTYDASSWIPAGDYGYLADDTGGNPKPFFERTGLEPANLWFHKAKWLFHPKTIYIRKSFTPNAGTGSVMLRGRGYTFKIYLNGQLVSESNTVVNRDELYRYDGNTLNSGSENVVAVEATCLDSIDFSSIRIGVQWGPGTARVLSDTTWKYSWSDPSGWNDVGFNDDSWAHVGDKGIKPEGGGEYSGVTDALTPARPVWATDMWFRYEFSAPTVGVLKINRIRPVTTGKAKPEYFNLAGQRVPAREMNVIGANGMIIKRTEVPGVSSGEKALKMGD